MITWRGLESGRDRETVIRLVKGSGFFTPEEVDLAAHYVDEAARDGENCDHRFLFAEQDGVPAGFSNYGVAGFSGETWYVHWIVVDNSLRGQGLGKAIMEKTEEDIRARGGRKIFVETSSTPLYVPTRAFYEKRGYTVEAVLKDYYRLGDDQVIFSKVIA